MGLEQTRASTEAPLSTEEQADPVAVTASRAAARLARQIALAVDEVGLSPSQYRVMAFLADGESVASALAGGINVTKPSITALIDGLEERGLVKRRRSAGDRRIVKTVLTDAGRETLAAADAAGSARLQQLAGCLSSADAQRALSGLATWNDALNAHLAKVRR